MKKEIAILCAILSLTSCGESKTAAPVYSYGVHQGVGSLGAHAVQKGDNLWTISQKYNLDLRGIIEANKLSPPYHLTAGSRLNLPAPQTYTVQPKDNIYTISRLFNTTQTELSSLNRLSSPYKLNAGQVLRIPQNYEVASIKTVAMETPLSPVIAPPSNVEAVALPPTVTTASSPEIIPPQPIPQQNVTPPPAQEVAAIKNPEPMPLRTGQFLKPVNGKIISSFGDKPDGQHNDGINIQAIKGDPVRAAENGQVVYVGNEIEGYGNMILLRHGDQYVTAYAHMAKTLVKKGETIRRGQTIGTVGSTGFVDKPQLHFEIRKGKKAVNPAGLI